MNINNNYISCPICKNIFLKTHIKIHFQICKKKTGQTIDLIQKENINIINLRNINNKNNKNIIEKNDVATNNVQISNKNIIEKNDVATNNVQISNKNIFERNNTATNNIATNNIATNNTTTNNVQISNKNIIEKNNVANNNNIEISNKNIIEKNNVANNNNIEISNKNYNLNLENKSNQNNNNQYNNQNNNNQYNNQNNNNQNNNNQNNNNQNNNNQNNNNQNNNNKNNNNQNNNNQNNNNQNNNNQNNNNQNNNNQNNNNQNNNNQNNNSIDKYDNKKNDTYNDTIIFNNNRYEMQVENYIRPELVNYSDNVLNYFFNEYNKLFYKYIEGKTIALVGPAQSIIGTGKGNIIDKFDLVVRLNKSIPLPSNIKDDIGSRSDIIYNSLNTSDFPGENNLNPKFYKKYGVKFVCTSYPFNHNVFHDDILNYVYKYKFELPLKVMNDLKFKNFEKSLGTRPYTGTCAIMDLLSYPIKYLYITGLDFYQTKYYSEYRRISKGTLKYNKNNMIHQCKPQIDYLKNISLFDNRIILDTFLDKLLYHDYYKVFKNLNLFEKNDIFNFGDIYFQKYFEMKVSLCTFTKNNININNNDNSKSYLIFTDNKYFNKNDNEYCMFITNEKNTLNILNSNLNSKRFIGNFYYSENKYNQPSIYMTSKFLGNLKSSLVKIGINNCNVNLAILLSLILYLPDNHYFSYNEIFNKWILSSEEKKFVLFLMKKNFLKLIM
jgi:hypothetical protein